MKSSAPRPVAFVLVSTEQGTMLVNRHDYRLTTQTTGYGVGLQLLNTGACDAGEVDLALRLLDSRRASHGNGVLAIDAGANIGVHTIEWSRFMTGWGEVLAFEPQERIYYALAGNITLNNCFNARALWAAVGAKSGAIGVPVLDYLVPSSFGSLALRPSGSVEPIGQAVDYSSDKLQRTQLIAIDDLKLPRLDFVKIDIEGMEMEALEGARQTIAAHKPHLMIEWIKSGSSEIDRFLGDLGYKVTGAGINKIAIHDSDPACRRIDSLVAR